MSNSTNTNSRHIPSDIVEEILLNLPVRSLLRFSLVSKSWNSMISKAGFKKRYGRHAALPGRERILIRAKTGTHACPLSAIFSVTHDKTTSFVCPIPGSTDPLIQASCDGLWCVKMEGSLFLWNPSTRTYRKLPTPRYFLPRDNFMCVYGLGYDSLRDDYKIIKICSRLLDPNSAPSEVYSLTSNSWTTLLSKPPLPETSAYVVYNRPGCAFVSGALHWLVGFRGHGTLIISFDLSTDKYGQVALPETSLHDFSEAELEINAMRGMLWLSANFDNTCCLSIWMMEDYGVGTSWTGKYKIDYSMFKELSIRFSYLRPIYVYDNGEVLIIEAAEIENCRVFLYRPADCSTGDHVVDKHLGLDCPIYCYYHVYVQSLISIS